MTQEELVSKVETIHFEPGDVLVLTMSEKQSDEAVARMHELLEKVVPKGNKCIVLFPGADIGVLRFSHAKELGVQT